MGNGDLLRLTVNQFLFRCERAVRSEISDRLGIPQDLVVFSGNINKEPTPRPISGRLICIMAGNNNPHVCNTF